MCIYIYIYIISWGKSVFEIGRTKSAYSRLMKNYMAGFLFSKNCVRIHPGQIFHMIKTKKKAKI
jgi:hypothetical protein